MKRRNWNKALHRQRCLRERETEGCGVYEGAPMIEAGTSAGDRRSAAVKRKSMTYDINSNNNKNNSKREKTHVEREEMQRERSRQWGYKGVKQHASVGRKKRQAGRRHRHSWCWKDGKCWLSVASAPAHIEQTHTHTLEGAEHTKPMR